jgi:hypothetical protein
MIISRSKRGISLLTDLKIIVESTLTHIKGSFLACGIDQLKKAKTWCHPKEVTDEIPTTLNDRIPTLYL